MGISRYASLKGNRVEFFQKKTFPSKQEKGLKFKGQTTLNGYAQLNLLPHLTGWDIKGTTILRGSMR